MSTSETQLGSTSMSLTTGTTEAVDTSGDTTASHSVSTGDADSGTSTGQDVCAVEQPAIVTDIDETLTLSDGEFIMQIQDGTYDPLEREGAAQLISAYADLGYSIFYLTARSETITLEGTGETAREATERWLEEHGFPFDPDNSSLMLSPMFVIGDTAQEYKALALAEQTAAGRRFDYAYGNATSDIGAYEEAGIAKEATFIIGEHAGEEGTVAVMGEGWTEHADAHLPMVPAVCGAG